MILRLGLAHTSIYRNERNQRLQQNSGISGSVCVLIICSGLQPKGEMTRGLQKPGSMAEQTFSLSLIHI